MTGRRVFLINDTGVSGHPGCVTVMAVIRDNLEMRGLAITGRWPMGAEPQLGLSVSPALRQAEAIIVNGEGTLHNTPARPGARRLVHAIRRARAASAAPLFLINATLENLRPKDFDVLRQCDGVYLRDRKSCDYAVQHGVGAIFTPDLCFSAGHALRPRQESLLVTDSTMPRTTVLLRRFAASIAADYRPMQLSRLRSMMHWAVTPHRHERQASACFGAISAASGLFTGRFHAAVFALMAATPFLAVGSNTAKIHALLDDVLGDQARLITLDRLAGAAPDIPPFSPQEKVRIKAYRAAALRSGQAMFDHIAQAAALAAPRVAA